jgi:hypothetical protein
MLLLFYTGEIHNIVTEEVDINFLEVMNTAELVKFMMDFVVNECLVVVSCVVSYYVIH